jgi:hypothetical protein
MIAVTNGAQRSSMPDTVARVVFFTFLPAVAAFGALGIPLFLCIAGVASIRPSLLLAAVEKRPLSIVLLLALTVWVVASSAWSPYPRAPLQALQIAIMVAAGLMFVASATAPSARRFTRALGIGAFVVLGILLSIEALWGMPLNGAGTPGAPVDELLRNVGRGATVLVAITWTAAAALFAYRTATLTAFGIAALALGGFVALQFGQSAHALAFAVGGVVFALALAAPRRMLDGVTGLLAVWTVAAPWVTPTMTSAPHLTEDMPRSWLERIRIWNYTADRIAEQPWIGRGLDAARAPPHTADIPLHPHSASLHLWFDTGVIGAVLAASVLIVGGRALARLFDGNRLGAAGASATIASLGVVANVSYGLWAEWWICTLFVAAALVGALAPLKPRA